MNTDMLTERDNVRALQNAIMMANRVALRTDDLLTREMIEMAIDTLHTSVALTRGLAGHPNE